MDPVTVSLITGGLGIGSNLLQGIMGAKAANKAASQAAQAQREALALSGRMYDETNQRLAPWVQTGQEANQRLAGLVSGMQQPGFDYQQKDFNFDAMRDPGAAYTMAEAVKALNASSLAKGGMGGGALKALNEMTQGIAQQNYQGAWNRYLDESKMRYGQASDKYGRAREFQQGQIGNEMGLANAGRESAMGLGNFGQAQGQFGAGLLSGIGQNQAAGTLGANNALWSGISGATNQLGGMIGNIWGSRSIDAPGQNWDIPGAQESPYKTLGAGRW